ncbi:MAG: hypothetical protein WCH39_27210 [Schlesneria sp.]
MAARYAAPNNSFEALEIVNNGKIGVRPDLCVLSFDVIIVRKKEPLVGAVLVNETSDHNAH